MLFRCQSILSYVAGRFETKKAADPKAARLQSGARGDAHAPRQGLGREVCRRFPGNEIFKGFSQYNSYYRILAIIRQTRVGYL